MIESEIDRGILVSRLEAERIAFHPPTDRYIFEIAAPIGSRTLGSPQAPSDGNTHRRRLLSTQSCRSSFND
ncbi:hypothetical protein [Pseudomonas putida]|uniref:hypothetical protein n=1 Tax=Pseudomonas putida TaxID=303 RepID=UPI001A8DEE50|nr:hypothetical protein [Pseudomonas putida]